MPRCPYTTTGVTLTLHSGVSAGILQEFHYGGYNQRYAYIIAGHPIVEMGLCVENSVSGQVPTTALLSALLQLAHTTVCACA